MAKYQPKHIRPKRPPQHFRPTGPQHFRYAPRPRSHMGVRARVVGLGLGSVALGTGAVVAVVGTGGAQVLDHSPKSHADQPATARYCREAPLRPCPPGK
jgi:hypothetical protein